MDAMEGTMRYITAIEAGIIATLIGVAIILLAHGLLA